MRNSGCTGDVFDRGNGGAHGQCQVDDHQVRPMPFSRGDSAVLSRLDRAGLVSKVDKHLGQNYADHSIVLNKKDAQLLHAATSSPAPPSFTLALT